MKPVRMTDKDVKLIIQNTGKIKKWIHMFLHLSNPIACDLRTFKYALRGVTHLVNKESSI